MPTNINTQQILNCCLSVLIGQFTKENSGLSTVDLLSRSSLILGQYFKQALTIVFPSSAEKEAIVGKE